MDILCIGYNNSPKWVWGNNTYVLLTCVGPVNSAVHCSENESAIGMSHFCLLSFYPFVLLSSTDLKRHLGVSLPTTRVEMAQSGRVDGGPFPSRRWLCPPASRLGVISLTNHIYICYIHQFHYSLIHFIHPFH